VINGIIKITEAKPAKLFLGIIALIIVTPSNSLILFFCRNVKKISKLFFKTSSDLANQAHTIIYPIIP